MEKAEKKRGKFIAFEGIDGSGKSTQVLKLTERLRKEGVAVHQTFEPTDGPIGRMIRDIFSHKMKADHRTIAGLFVADRLHHLLEPKNGVLKFLDEGSHVVMDRYLFSSYAYQGAHVDMEWVISANAESARILQPDLYVFIDLEPSKALERLAAGRSELEIFETRENLRMVYDQYRIVLDRFGDRHNILRVDGDRSPETVAQEIWEAVYPLISSGR